jgi:hypothetical protein
MRPPAWDGVRAGGVVIREAVGRSGQGAGDPAAPAHEENVGCAPGATWLPIPMGRATSRIRGDTAWATSTDSELRASFQSIQGPGGSKMGCTGQVGPRRANDRPRGAEERKSTARRQRYQPGKRRLLARSPSWSLQRQEDPMSRKPTTPIVRDANREQPLQAALAALDRSVAEEQKFDAARRRTLDRGEPAAREGRAE